MTTKAVKEKYKISVNGAGCWCGTCPACGEVFSATDISVSQANVIATIEKHETTH